MEKICPLVVLNWGDRRDIITGNADVAELVYAHV